MHDGSGGHGPRRKARAPLAVGVGWDQLAESWWAGASRLSDNPGLAQTEQADLCRVGRDDSDVAGRKAAIDQRLNLLADDLRFGRVASALAVGLDFFVVASPGRVDEPERRVSNQSGSDTRQILQQVLFDT